MLRILCDLMKDTCPGDSVFGMTQMFKEAYIAFWGQRMISLYLTMDSDNL